jgi:hypothetical protein
MTATSPPCCGCRRTSTARRQATLLPPPLDPDRLLPDLDGLDVEFPGFEFDAVVESDVDSDFDPDSELELELVEESAAGELPESPEPFELELAEDSLLDSADLPLSLEPFVDFARLSVL